MYCRSTNGVNVCDIGVDLWFQRMVMIFLVRFWGMVKAVVCGSNPRAEDDLQQSIQNDMLCHDYMIFNYVMRSAVIV
jgi:hypothetical protein